MPSHPLLQFSQERRASVPLAVLRSWMPGGTSRNEMKTRPQSLVAGVLTCALLIGAGFIVARHLAASEKIRPQRVSTFLPPAVEGLSIPIYSSDGKPYSLLRVGTCRLRQEKAGIFGWGSILVAEMNNVQIDVQSQPAPPDAEASGVESSSSQVVASLKDIPRYLRWETVKNVDVRGVTIHVQDRGDSVSTIQAARLSPLPRGQFLLERGIVLTADGGQRQLTCDEVVWWPDWEIYAVKGQYTLKDAEGVQKGRHTLFHTTLEPITNNEEIVQYEQRATRTASSNVPD